MADEINTPNGPGQDPENLPNRLGAWVPPVQDKDPRRYHMYHFLPDAMPEALASAAVFHRVPETPLDQANTSSCVGQDGRIWELSYPNPYERKPGDDQPAQLDQARWPAIDNYFAAQSFDEWPGGEYPGASPTYEGSSLDGLAKYYQMAGRINGAYAWAKSAQDVIDWLRLQTGVMFASLWFRDMFTPDSKGYIHPTGQIDGGHAYFLFGVDTSDTVYGLQSWGDWGLKNQSFDSAHGSFTVKTGVFKINRSDLVHLFEYGDAEGFAPVKLGGMQPPAPPQPEAYFPNLPRVGITSSTRFINRESVLTKLGKDVGHYTPKGDK